MTDEARCAWVNDKGERCVRDAQHDDRDRHYSASEYPSGVGYLADVRGGILHRRILADRAALAAADRAGEEMEREHLHIFISPSGRCDVAGCGVEARFLVERPPTLATHCCGVAPHPGMLCKPGYDYGDGERVRIDWNHTATHVQGGMPSDLDARIAAASIEAELAKPWPATMRGPIEARRAHRNKRQLGGVPTGAGPGRAW